MIGVTKSKTSGAALAFPDMTALLDVIFILLVFLLLTANAVPKVLEVALPEDGAEQAPDLEVNDQISITLFAESGRWGIASDEYDNWHAFERALTEKIRATREPQIVLAGDRQVALEKLMKMFSWLQANNLAAAQILMEPSAPTTQQ